MPDIIHNKLPDRFRFILNHVTCIKWLRDPAAQEVFWIMLQRSLLDGEEMKDKAPVKNEDLERNSDISDVVANSSSNYDDQNSFSVSQVYLNSQNKLILQVVYSFDKYHKIF